MVIIGPPNDEPSFMRIVTELRSTVLDADTMMSNESGVPANGAVGCGIDVPSEAATGAFHVKSSGSIGDERPSHAQSVNAITMAQQPRYRTGIRTPFFCEAIVSREQRSRRRNKSSGAAAITAAADGS
jgi:hypothetical protein